MRLHHVQVSIAKDGEDLARSFYGAALGLTEVPKPAALARRGGCWFRAFEGGTVVAEIFEGYERFHCRDPFDNRVEVLSPVAG